jgi:hypothetical protein
LSPIQDYITFHITGYRVRCAGVGIVVDEASPERAAAQEQNAGRVHLHARQFAGKGNSIGDGQELRHRVRYRLDAVPSGYRPAASLRSQSVNSRRTGGDSFTPALLEQQFRHSIHFNGISPSARYAGGVHVDERPVERVGQRPCHVRYGRPDQSRQNEPRRPRTHDILEIPTFASRVTVEGPMHQ